MTRRTYYRRLKSAKRKTEQGKPDKLTRTERWALADFERLLWESIKRRNQPFIRYSWDFASSPEPRVTVSIHPRAAASYIFLSAPFVEVTHA